MAAAAVAEQEAAVEAMYGKVPVEEFDQARADLEYAREDAIGAPKTFREDYEVSGAATGTVRFRYGGACTSCGLFLQIDERHPLYTADGEASS